MDANTLSQAMGGALPLARYEALLPASYAGASDGRGQVWYRFRAY